MPPSFHNTDSCIIVPQLPYLFPLSSSELYPVNSQPQHCSFLQLPISISLPPPPSPVPLPSPSPRSIPTLFKINASHRPPHARLHQIVSPRPIYYLTTLPGLTHRLHIPPASRFSPPSPPASSTTHHPILGIPLNPLLSSFHESLFSTPHQLHHPPLPTKLTPNSPC